LKGAGGGKAKSHSERKGGGGVRHLGMWLGISLAGRVKGVRRWRRKGRWWRRRRKRGWRCWML